MSAEKAANGGEPHRGFVLIQKPYSVELLSRSLRKAIS
jgi:hypothetical protein